ncbi:MAG: hypothetical protein ACOYBQ_00655 [Fluviibacter sp.]|jgi:hypothetical protein
MSPYELTVYMLAGALVLNGWACCRLLPKLPGSGGVRGLRFWWALLLVVVLDRTLNTAFFTVQTSLFDQPDAVRCLLQAALLYGITSLLLRQPVASLEH